MKVKYIFGKVEYVFNFKDKEDAAAKYRNLLDKALRLEVAADSIEKAILDIAKDAEEYEKLEDYLDVIKIKVCQSDPRPPIPLDEVVEKLGHNINELKDD